MQARRINWLTPNPELLVAVLGERFGLRSQLRLGGMLPHFEDNRVAVDSSAGVLRGIMAVHPRVLLVHNPDYFELVSGGPQPITLLLGQRSGLAITFMAGYLASDTDLGDIARWFNLPHDGHFSDYGAQRYAEAVHAMLRDRMERGELVVPR